ncbi:MAG: non-hydrolyzing UDP-N-acetylglucosamine 2-epimerase [Fimbriimonadaceae bacterium]
MSKVLTVVGARPQFIKAAPVSKALQAVGCQEFLVHTGQHYDESMSERFFRELGLSPPDENLHVGSSSHGAQTGAMMAGLEPIVMERRPDWLLVYGDTNSTLSGALVAAKLHIPVAHVEAGLRSFNRAMPEEVNRLVTDHLSTLLFAPTDTAIKNLALEGIAGDKVRLVGDVMYDAALAAPLDGTAALLDRLNLTTKEFCLATVHRAENTDVPARLQAILQGLAAVAERMPVILPCHPRTKPLVGDVCGVTVIEPLGYNETACLLRAAAVVATDSGGLQKEAYFHGTPCVTLRDETEWVELVELGWNTLAPPLSASAVESAILGAVGTNGRDGTPYGQGDAAAKIAEALA